MKVVLVVLILTIIIANGQITNEPVQELVNQKTVTVSTGNDNKDILTCLCNLNTNICDQFCCCDTACSSSDRQLWKDNKKCKSETLQNFENQEFPDCKTWRDNPSSSKIYSNQINSITCVFLDNTSYQGYFYKLNNAKSAPNDDEYDSNKLHLSQNSAVSTTSLPKIYLSGKTYIYYGTQQKVFSLPAGDPFGYCNNQAPLTYANQFSVNCVDTFQLDQYNIAYKNNLVTNLKLIIKDLASTSTFIDANFVDNRAGNDSVDLIRLANGRCTLINALNKITIIFNTQNSVIQNGTVTFEYTQIIDQPCTDIRKLPLSIQATFTEINPSANADDLVIPVSGVPGYKNGRELLIGRANQFNQRSIVDRYADGYQLNGADQNGICLTTATTRPLNNKSKVVNFAEDFSVSCTVQITQAECNNANYMNDKWIQNFIIPKQAGSTVGQTVIGRYGVADYYVFNDWVEVTESSFWKSLTKQTGYCQPPAMQILTIFYAESGAVGNEQQYVSRAEVGNPPNNIWKWNSNGPATQNFQFTLMINFEKIEYDDLMANNKSPQNTLDKWIEQAFGGIKK